MPKYQYKAKNMAGNIIEGVYEAQNKDAVISMIRQKSYFHLEVKEIIERKDVNEMGVLGKIKPKELSVYCKQFSSILKAGVPLLQSLKMVGEQTENKMLKTITLNVREEVQKGSSLANAMEIHSNNKLPPMLINMVEAGEMSGSLENSFDVMSVHFEKEHKTKSKVKSALRYPIIVSIVAVAVVILLMVKVVPIFANMFSSQGQELPLPTK
ncbi:MAG: type II secretion system F family protein, partial [Clostridiales bacterium]|nr:type II secretion system F family protein [Clostridiales bacterium]